ncbi:hypothetical protein [Chitinolyticbacter albus]|uniref:hypothetical protein n=1 Tax=Chitinolyticbacter albus TaxID=2961951 RepID=UPI00210E2E41|nr:hypothetical protein [Chitinolyticbacter albus]
MRILLCSLIWMLVVLAWPAAAPAAACPESAQPHVAVLADPAAHDADCQAAARCCLAPVPLAVMPTLIAPQGYLAVRLAHVPRGRSLESAAPPLPPPRSLA